MNEVMPIAVLIVVLTLVIDRSRAYRLLPAALNRLRGHGPRRRR